MLKIFSYFTFIINFHSYFALKSYDVTLSDTLQKVEKNDLTLGANLTFQAIKIEILPNF